MFSYVIRVEQLVIYHLVVSAGVQVWCVRLCILSMELKETVLKAFEQNRNAVLYTVGAGVALLGVGIGYKYIRRAKKLTQVGVVSQLILHPIKSGKGLQVATAECLRMGLKYGELKDRCVLQQSHRSHSDSIM